MFLKNPNLSVKIFGDGILQLCNNQDFVLELALLPLDCGFEQLFPIENLKKYL